MRSNRGFTLIEVLIAFFVLSFGLLGAVALQAKAKQASFDSMQRAAAVALANDIMQRIRVNDFSTLSNLYKVTFTSQTALSQSNSCFSNSCTSQQIANLDIEQWKLAIRARENTGALENTTVCITPTKAAGGKGNRYNIEVVVSWEGRQKLEGTDATNAISCGTASNKRRVVQMTSFLLVRV
ncbi:type IV pilus modification protein PilV [Pseudoalteromonas xiamenensis]|uniref:Type IV pilus modification protein PilV n=1 Tax=Pseudoalteromonas xiamenensis TaxID=882626 RepID=A0A975HMJ8_9GAMM|nr:type IV pilus modification protein PilV [Pseudoalteromonas xiamenensis]QTH71170.1 type IV pilus modification protein PilV [Pseudoalteromonas xiamenensis]WMN59511.1 type IV pilus modification protein PilV [Pseudoalteromonas xiamenensis]